MTETVKIKPKDKEHYVSNRQLYETYIDWHKGIKEAEAKGEETPVMPRYIAESIIKICTRLSYKPNFFGYSYVDEMRLDAIENCSRTAKNFNPAKSTFPFSFFTTIAYHAFLRRIEKEKRESYIKSRMMIELPVEELMDMEEDDAAQLQNQYMDYLRENNFLNQEEPLAVRKRKARKNVELPSPLDQLFEHSDDEDE